MVLLLAVHSFKEVTAKVPFAVILLQDLVSNKKCPPELKCRQMTPTSGSRSTSLWDAPDPESLLQWLNENVNVDCENEVFEVQEEFSIGVMGEVGRARTAEKVAAGARDLGEKTASTVGKAATAVSHQAQEIDHKLKISERAGAAATAVKESAAMKSTAAFFSKAGSAVKSATTRVVDNDRVSNATEKLAGSFKKLGSTLSQSFANKGRVNSSADDALALDDDNQAPHYARQPVAEYEAPHQEAAVRNPAVVAAAASAAAAPPAAVAAPEPAPLAADPTPASPPPETLAFTLDDSEAPPSQGKQQ